MKRTAQQTLRALKSSLRGGAVSRPGMATLKSSVAHGTAARRAASALARAAAGSASVPKMHGQGSRSMSTFKDEYDGLVAARSAQHGIVPEALNAQQVADLVELLKAPPAGEEEFLVDLLENRVPPGVDEAAYVKAGFLAAVAKGEAQSPLVSKAHAVKLLGTMQGGYNIGTLIELLDSADDELASLAAEGLKHTLLMFDSFYDVEAKAKEGNAHAKAVMQSWADAEWFTAKPAVPEKITVTVFKVTGETNTDDLSPAQDAWSRPDIPLHA